MSSQATNSSAMGGDLFSKGVYAYDSILIDTDMEPDDKAALILLMKRLSAHASQNKNYSYPNIIIIAGSSKAPALKKAQAEKIVHKLIDEGVMPQNASVIIKEGSPTEKDHHRDGEELISQEEIASLKSQKPEYFNKEAIKAIISFLLNEKGEKRLYLGLREVKDLRKAHEIIYKSLNGDETEYLEAEEVEALKKSSEISGKPYIPRLKNVDFMGTMSFNITNVYRGLDGGDNFINNVLPMFENALCYENHHSACKMNSTKVWGEGFRDYLRSDAGSPLKMAAELWDASNIYDCIHTLSNPNYDGNKVKDLGINTWQAEESFKSFSDAWERSTKNILTMSAEDFRKKIFDIYGPAVVNEINKENSAAQKAFNSNAIPFENMVFNSPQLCLADLAFIAVISDLDMLSGVIEKGKLKYNGRFSCWEKHPLGHMHYVVMNESQLKSLGVKALKSLSGSV